MAHQEHYSAAGSGSDGDGQAKLSGSCQERVTCISGADRDRTGDPLLAKQVLSQLSYRPPKVLQDSDFPAQSEAALAWCAGFYSAYD
jgi:hypothetical protein